MTDAPTRGRRVPSHRHGMTASTQHGIRKRIGLGVLMSVGARNLRDGEDSLTFEATILPFDDNGIRSERPRKMTVTVIEHSVETFGVYVSYESRGVTVTHFQSDRIPAARLSRTLLALDFDGDQPLNPRFA